MSEPKFTPGTWIWKPCLSEKGGWIEIHVKQKNSTVCIANTFGENEVENAHLISSAPEMYEMLDEAIAYLQTENASYYSEPIKRFKKVLKKARGEE